MDDPIQKHVEEMPGLPEPSGNGSSGVVPWSAHEFQHLRDGTVICTVCDSVVVGAK